MINLLNPYTCIAFCLAQTILLILAINCGKQYDEFCAWFITCVFAILFIVTASRLVEILLQVSWT